MLSHSVARATGWCNVSSAGGLGLAALDGWIVVAVAILLFPLLVWDFPTESWRPKSNFPTSNSLSSDARLFSWTVADDGGVFAPASRWWACCSVGNSSSRCFSRSFSLLAAGGFAKIIGRFVSSLSLFLLPSFSRPPSLYPLLSLPYPRSCLSLSLSRSRSLSLKILPAPLSPSLLLLFVPLSFSSLRSVFLSRSLNNMKWYWGSSYLRGSISTDYLCQITILKTKLTCCLFLLYRRLFSGHRFDLHRCFFLLYFRAYSTLFLIIIFLHVKLLLYHIWYFNL